MTIEKHNKSCEILTRLNLLDEEIDELKRITKQDTTLWIMEIRELETFPLKKSIILACYQSFCKRFFQSILRNEIDCKKNLMNYKNRR